MQFLFVLFSALVLIGCAKNKSASGTDEENLPGNGPSRKSTVTTPAQKKSVPAQNENKPVITPSPENAGRVSKVNDAGRFVVLTFPDGNVPAIERKLSLYRNGLKVAEIRITGPQRDYNTVADIVAGDAQVHDEVRK